MDRPPTPPRRPVRRRRKYLPWSAQEDALILSLVGQSARPRWISFKRFFPGRTSKQIRERWLNQLNPGINRAEWGEEEDWLLFLLWKVNGNAWSLFRNVIRGRGDNQIKNHWNSSMKNRLESFEKKLLRAFEGGEERLEKMEEGDEKRCLLALFQKAKLANFDSQNDEKANSIVQKSISESPKNGAFPFKDISQNLRNFGNPRNAENTDYKDKYYFAFHSQNEIYEDEAKMKKSFNEENENDELFRPDFR